MRDMVPRQNAEPQTGSAHVVDPFLHDFLHPSFDAADYFNKILPPLQHSGLSTLSSPSTAVARSAAEEAVSIAELSTKAQTTLSHLDAHTSRLSNTLTQLTDEILRSGSRLAYEVELLRGETLGLAETLDDRLRDDIQEFVPGGLKSAGVVTNLPPTPITLSHSPDLKDDTDDMPVPVEPSAVTPNEPSHITQLRTLALVRSRLESVVKTFGDAMEFVFPPSELFLSSSFLSVSAPDAGGASHSTEEKGQQVLQKLRDEISALLDNPQDPIKGIEDAARRVEELKELNKVWKGTNEEKGRTKFIEGLARVVGDKHKDLLKDMERASKGKPEETTTRKAAADADTSPAESNGYGAYGLISQLQKLRNGL